MRQVIPLLNRIRYHRYQNIARCFESISVSVDDHFMNLMRCKIFGGTLMRVHFNNLIRKSSKGYHNIKSDICSKRTFRCNSGVHEIRSHKQIRKKIRSFMIVCKCNSIYSAWNFREESFIHANKLTILFGPSSICDTILFFRPYVELIKITHQIDCLDLIMGLCLVVIINIESPSTLTFVYMFTIDVIR